MNLRGKTFSRVIACTLVAGLAAPYVLPADAQADNTKVYAEDAVVGTLLSAADTFLGKPEDMKYCAVYNDGSKSFNMNGRTFKQGVVLNEGSYSANSASVYNVKDVKKLTMTFQATIVKNKIF